MVTLEYSQHICRVISTVFGAVLVSVCAMIALALSWLSTTVRWTGSPRTTAKFLSKYTT